MKNEKRKVAAVCCANATQITSPQAIQQLYTLCFSLYTMIYEFVNAFNVYLVPHYPNVYRPLLLAQEQEH
jgi:hypothetical protein